MADDRSPADRTPPPSRAAAVRGLLHDMPEAARGAIDGGRALYRRGAIAVTETAGDNGALILLAGGAAAAGLSWLWLRARKRAR